MKNKKKGVCTPSKNQGVDMRAYELREKLFTKDELLVGYYGAVDQILCAFADSHDGLKEERNLNFFCNHAFDRELAIKIAERCIVDYNFFNAKTMEQVINLFGDALYYFARENSACIYIRPLKNVWLSNAKKEEIKWDEFTFDSNLQMFRIWWD
jgi:hypothetical protein